MPALRKWKQFATTLKTIFTGKSTPSKIIPFSTKVTHRKLRIPDAPEKTIHARKKLFSETAID